MKLILDVKNVGKVIKPSKDNLIMYDGKEWYVTTKQDLLKEYNEHFDKKIKECDNKIDEMNTLKLDIAKQILDFNDVIKTTILGKEK